ncbi:uncharacterized protein LOC116348503 [Contarinia nasturtii]|uniref:uncharacterized protein LOC116348503 n=1 Tax=Contarinia nasturtii TaxID=265458 RepID=UPI0012D3B6E9|nr:uncharacterized protein LOC116348503 [Contarinia nasturtii]
MSPLTHNGLNRFKALYLNEDGADVWFKFRSDRIPAHKLILTTMSPWLNTMFFGSMPEGNEVDMINSQVSANAFKEFLQFFYMDDVNLSIDHIEGVIDLAKQSLTDHIFNECENFLMKSITTDKMCFGYQLALRYGANKLKAICEEEICVYAETILRSSSFLEFPYEFLENLLKCDALACEEKDVFNACIAWAKSVCKLHEKDPSKAENLRAELKDTVYQIRFVSMTKEEIASCIASYPGLFFADELEEIICMNGQVGEVMAKKFNWSPRYFNLQWDKGRHLDCNRFAKWNLWTMHRLKKVEKLLFTTNRRVLLNGFICECGDDCNKEVDILITEMKINGPDIVERYSEKQVTLDFNYKRNKCESYLALVTLKKALLLRPKYKYEIKISIRLDEIEKNKKSFSRTTYKKNVLLDFDIKLRFEEKYGFISQLNLIRFDNKNIVQKLIHSPLAWFGKEH